MAARQGTDSHSAQADMTGRLERSDAAAIAGAVVLAFAARLIVAAWDPVVVRDGIGHLRTARAFARGDIRSALLHPRDPGYPFMISLVGRLTGDFELAGELVAVLMGALGAVPLYLLARRLAPRPAPALAGFLYALHPLGVELGSRVLPESMLVLAFLWAFLLLARGVIRPSTRDVAWACGLCGTSYFIKPEAMLLCTLMFLVGGIFLLRTRKKAQPESRGIRCAAVALVVLGVVIAGYMLWLDANNPQANRGFRMSSKIFVGGRLAQRFRQEGLYNLLRTARNFPKDFGLWLVPLLLIGLLRKRTPAQRRACLALGSVAVTYLVVSGLYRYSPRHEAQMFPLLLVWAADGAALAAGLVARGRTSSRTYRAAFGVLAVAACSTSLLVALRPTYRDNLHILTVGLYIKENLAEAKTIMSDDPRYAYYAQKEFVKLPEEKPLEELARSLKQHAPELLVVQDEDLADFGLDTGAHLLNGVLRRQAVVGDQWGRAFVYSVHPDLSPPAVTIAGPTRKVAEGVSVVITYSADEPVAEYRTRLLPVEGRFTRTKQTVATYKSLSPGGYEFQVVAVDLSGNRQEQPASHRFRVVRSDRRSPERRSMSSP